MCNHSDRFFKYKGSIHMSDSRQEIRYLSFFQQDFFLFEIDGQDFIDLLAREAVEASLLDEFKQCKMTILSSADLTNKAIALEKMYRFLLALKPLSEKSEEAILLRIRLMKNAIHYIASECEAEKFLFPLGRVGISGRQVYSAYTSVTECLANPRRLKNPQVYWTAFYTADWVKKEKKSFLLHDEAVGEYNAALGDRSEWFDLPEDERCKKIKNANLLRLLENIIQIIKDYLAKVEHEENYSINVANWQYKLVSAEKILPYMKERTAKNNKSELTPDEIRMYINGEMSEPEEELKSPNCNMR
jgi:hypothetical protein